MYSQLKSVFNAISPITEDDWNMIEPQLRTKEYKKNSFYLRAGETEEQIGFTTRGSFKWYYINQKGEEVNFHFFFDSNFVVEYRSFITRSPARCIFRQWKIQRLFFCQNVKKYWNYITRRTIGNDSAGSFLKPFMLKLLYVFRISYLEALKNVTGIFLNSILTSFREYHFQIYLPTWVFRDPP